MSDFLSWKTGLVIAALTIITGFPPQGSGAELAGWLTTAVLASTAVTYVGWYSVRWYRSE